MRPCLAAIEVGNEINGPGTLVYPAGANRAAAYVATLKAVRARIGGRTAVLGGSTNTIGTGFLKSLFAAGMLAEVDGIAVHPYRSRAEGLDIELAQLNAAMDAAGRRVPVWASEFSRDTSDQPLAAGELVKQATMLAAAGNDGHDRIASDALRFEDRDQSLAGRMLDDDFEPLLLERLHGSLLRDARTGRPSDRAAGLSSG